MRKLLIPWILLCVLGHSLTASNAYYFEYTDLAKAAYKSALSLKFEESQRLLTQLKQSDPNNLILYHVENYIDFLKVYIAEDEQTFESFKRQKHHRINLVKNGDENSPYFLFIQATIRFQVGLVRLKYGEYLPAFQDISRAHKLLKRNQKLYPDFIPNLKDLGILHAIVGTIPANYQWGIKFFTGLEGTIQQGKRELNQVLKHCEKAEFLFEQETQILYGLLMLMIENSPERSWKYLNSCGLNPRENPLHCYVLANVAMRSGRNDKAIEVLLNRPKGEKFFTFHSLNYMLGLAKTRRLDADAAYYLKEYVNHFEGKFQVKAAYQKLAWIALVNGDQQAYKKHIKKCLENGAATNGEDIMAEKEAKNGFIPNPILTKARLLFDGGYYEKAYESISKLSETDVNNSRELLELYYRKGRILHGMKKYKEAISHYYKAMQKGEKEPYYYACNAALQIGLIFEIQGQPDQAKNYFNKCLNISPSEYKSSLHQKAKAGLARIES